MMKRKLLAWICRCCPFCIARRWFPASRYAHMMAQAEKDCPCCRAYAEEKGYTWPKA